MVDVPALLPGAKGFVGLRSPRVLASGRDGAPVRLDAAPELPDHLGGPPAAVLSGLGETAASAVLLGVFGDLVVAGAVPLGKSSRIAFSAVATGPVLAGAALPGEEAGDRASYEQRGTAVCEVEVAFRRESDDVQTARATYATAVRRPS